MELYPDQVSIRDKVIDAFDEYRGVVLPMPTGTGKTVVASSLVQLAHASDSRMLALVHRRELLHQFVKTAHEAGLGSHIGAIVPDQPFHSWRPHHAAMIQTLIRRPTIMKQLKPDLIVIDEGHRAAANTYTKLLAEWPDASVLYLTATPQRHDGKGLRKAGAEYIVDCPPTEWYIKNGRLCPYRHIIHKTTISETDAKVQGGDYRRKDLEDTLLKKGAIAEVVPHIQALPKDRHWLAFGPSVEVSQQLEARLHKLSVSCRHLDGNTPDHERDAALRAFKDGYLAGLLTVDIFIEGVDCPAADTAIVYRKTKSMTIARQILGRILRFQPGKVATLIDLGGLYHEHGRLCAPYRWDLDGRQKSEKDPAAHTGMRRCSECFCMTPAGHPCQLCGAEPPPPSKPKEVPVELIEIDLGYEVEKMMVERINGRIPAAQLSKLASKAWKLKGREGLETVAKMLKYDRRWVNHQVRLRQPGRWAR